MAVALNRTAHYTVVRSSEARDKGIPEPPDPSRYTTVTDPTAPFRFAFPDLTGHVVANTDERFAGKVIILSIGGSWCPNCHDEAPLLVELYKKYRAQGLEIVLLSFEEAEQMKNPARVRAFMKKYGIDDSTAQFAPITRTRDICRSTFRVFVTRTGVQSMNRSAQSPP